MATIALNPDPPAALGATVTFTVDGVPNNVKNARVLINAYQDDSLVYGEAGSVHQATCDGEDSLGYCGFLLGGGSSTWLSNGGPAHCVASLFYFSQHAGQQTQITLATTEFDAAG